MLVEQLDNLGKLFTHFLFENKHISCFQRRNGWYTNASPHLVAAPRRGTSWPHLVGAHTFFF